MSPLSGLHLCGGGGGGGDGGGADGGGGDGSCCSVFGGVVESVPPAAAGAPLGAVTELTPQPGNSNAAAPANPSESA
jgi:hypothetical protein